MDTQEHAIHPVWIHLIPTSLYPRREEKTFASQETTLTTRPWLLGQLKLPCWMVKLEARRAGPQEMINFYRDSCVIFYW